MVGMVTLTGTFTLESLVAPFLKVAAWMLGMTAGVVVMLMSEPPAVGRRKTETVAAGEGVAPLLVRVRETVAEAEVPVMMALEILGIFLRVGRRSKVSRTARSSVVETLVEASATVVVMVKMPSAA